MLLYGCETWRTTKALHQKIQCFVNTCLRRILGIRWPDRISNTDLWERAGQEPLAKQILQRKWGWIGHTLRKPPANITRQALSWNWRGRPCNSWRRDTEAELKAQKLSWKGACDAAQNRVRWRGMMACAPTGAGLSKYSKYWLLIVPLFISKLHRSWRLGRY